IRDFVPSLQSYRPGTIAVHASTLRSFLGYLYFKGILVHDLSHAVERPRFYRWSQPPPVFDSEIVEHLLESVDRTTAIAKRDYAIVLFAARHGLRDSASRKLRVENVVWEEHRIVLLLSQTQRRVELPLLREVAAALVDFIRRARPGCGEGEIFV